MFIIIRDRIFDDWEIFGVFDTKELVLKKCFDFYKKYYLDNNFLLDETFYFLDIEEWDINNKKVDFDNESFNLLIYNMMKIDNEVQIHEDKVYKLKNLEKLKKLEKDKYKKLQNSVQFDDNF